MGLVQDFADNLSYFCQDYSKPQPTQCWNFGVVFRNEIGFTGLIEIWIEMWLSRITSILKLFQLQEQSFATANTTSSESAGKEMMGYWKTTFQ